MGKTNFEQRSKNANLCLLSELAHGQGNFFFLPPKEAQGKVRKSQGSLRRITLRVKQFTPL